MKPQGQAILNYGLMLSAIMHDVDDHVTMISSIVRQNHMQDDPDLTRIGVKFHALLVALQDMDCELELQAAKYLEA